MITKCKSDFSKKYFFIFIVSIAICIGLAYIIYHNDGVIVVSKTYTNKDDEITIDNIKISKENSSVCVILRPQLRGKEGTFFITIYKGHKKIFTTTVHKRFHIKERVLFKKCITTSQKGDYTFYITRIKGEKVPISITIKKDVVQNQWYKILFLIFLTIVIISYKRTTEYHLDLSILYIIYAIFLIISYHRGDYETIYLFLLFILPIIAIYLDEY